jgi:hypothetical protein
VRSVDPAKTGLQIVRCSFLFLIVTENGDGFDGGAVYLLNQTVGATGTHDTKYNPEKCHSGCFFAERSALAG